MYKSAFLCLILLPSIVMGKVLDTESFQAYKDAHPMEFSGKFEGDIVLDDSFRSSLKYARKWENGVVLYDLSQLHPSAHSYIKRALDDLQSRIGVDCIKFVETKETIFFGSVIKVFSGDGCYSYVGRQLLPQDISIAIPGCLFKSTIQHEFLHAMGFVHEHTRSDRDKYLDIHWENIDNKAKLNFALQNSNNLRTPYNYMSIMHYGDYTFSKNGRPTMTAKLNTGKDLGRRVLHHLDVAAVRKLYKCNKEDNLVECKDEAGSVKCWWWRLRGYCSDDEQKTFMEENCSKSCEFCW